MSGGGNAARLAAVTRDFLDQWALLRDTWSDRQARQFEADFVQALETAARAAEQRIQALETLLFEIRRDCE
jgi:hypothetical protein